MTEDMFVDVNRKQIAMKHRLEDTELQSKASDSVVLSIL